MVKLLLISVLAIIIATVAIGLSIKADQHIADSCVTQSDWDTSLGHYFLRANALQQGQNVLLSTKEEGFYKDMLTCLKQAKSALNESSIDRRLELLPRLQMVDSAFREDGEFCVRLITDKKICS